MKDEVLETECMSKELTQEYFEANFFDIRQHGPKKGQVLAQFRACAAFVDGWVKENVVTMLKDNKAGAESAHKVMRNMVGATEYDSIKVLLAITEDLMAGLDVDTILKKEYDMVIEYYYWATKECVPVDDPHWKTITLKEKDDKYVKSKIMTE